ncbi:alpha/beta hydrolase [Mycobacterium sp. MYCO198283]|uniref:alpha/beta hydrolase n=1 Tax=Mycobacterium sp. MYCO198283 TaxID=2883505 RepID=UPI001E2D8B89|nr:alpha/beta hydrolase [Mycobacterium sp. MYCO198283]MCG5431567.1 alpha/beta hydrolase [Mycobacterium sp. MYCO198283]
MTSDLHVYRYGPDEPVRVLALHGLTGHGRRWEPFAEQQLPGIGVAAPDLLGHGRSSWSAPWTIDANVAALAALLRGAADGAVVVVGHSFGGAVALHLAAAHPELVRALVLLDPAVGLDGDRMRRLAEQTLASPDYADRAEARADKLAGSWSEVDGALLDAELDEHLVDWPGGRVGWRMSLPAVIAYWSELARPVVVPTVSVPTTVLRAAKVQPPYATDALLDALRRRLGEALEVRELDCDHMVPLARPDESGAAVRRHLT